MGTTADLLARAREQVGLSQRELAAKANIPQASVSRVERGLISPRASTIERWLEACGMTLEIKPAAGFGVDLSTIRERLAMTPLERSRLGTQEAIAMLRLERARLRRSQP